MPFLIIIGLLAVYLFAHHSAVSASSQPQNTPITPASPNGARTAGAWWNSRTQTAVATALPAPWASAQGTLVPPSGGLFNLKNPDTASGDSSAAAVPTSTPTGASGGTGGTSAPNVAGAGGGGGGIGGGRTGASVL